MDDSKQQGAVGKQHRSRAIKRLEGKCVPARTKAIASASFSAVLKLNPILLITVMPYFTTYLLGG